MSVHLFKEELLMAFRLFVIVFTSVLKKIPCLTCFGAFYQVFKNTTTHSSFLKMTSTQFGYFFQYFPAESQLADGGGGWCRWRCFCMDLLSPFTLVNIFLHLLYMNKECFKPYRYLVISFCSLVLQKSLRSVILLYQCLYIYNFSSSRL